MRLNEAINVKWKDVEFGGNRPGLRIDGGAQDTKMVECEKFLFSQS